MLRVRFRDAEGTVGDATLDFTPAEVRHLLADVLRNP